MKSGANYIVLSRLDVDIEQIQSAIFAFKGKEKITKVYPDEVTADNNVFAVKLYQEDTIKLQGEVLCEVQINYYDGSVSKSELQTLYIGETLNTELVEGDSPSGSVKDVKFEIVGNAIIAKIEGDIDPADIEKAVNDYLEEHPVEAGITTEECEQIVANYVIAHKTELKGDKGDKGDKGEQGIQGIPGEKGADGQNGKDGINGIDGKDGADGKDYVITSSDYDLIADVVISKLPKAESEEY